MTNTKMTGALVADHFAEMVMEIMNRQPAAASQAISGFCRRVRDDLDGAGLGVNAAVLVLELEITLRKMRGLDVPGYVTR